MQHLFQSWELFSSDIRTASHILFLSDFDGTLTPIAGRPAEAVLSPEVREKICAMTTKSAFSVGIISGRSLPEIKAMVQMDGIYYAGNHGMEIEGPGMSYIDPVALEEQPRLKQLAGELHEALDGIAGVIIEDKNLSLSVHYRLVKVGQEKEVARIFQEVTAPMVQAGRVRATSGKKVWEVRPPVDWNKGEAVETIRRKAGKLISAGESLTIYLGDDTTDEDAFRVVHQPEGWSIFVGEDNLTSSAEYFLMSTDEVAAFLDSLLALK